MTRELLLARLHLEAVLPAAAELVAAGDREARGLAASDFSLELRVDDGLRTCLIARRGVISIEPRREGEVCLQFRDARALNALFLERLGMLPLPVRGWWRAGTMVRFAQLAKRMGAVLQGHAGVPRELHAKLAFGVAMRALPLLAEHDAAAGRVLAASPAGIVSLAVPVVDFQASADLGPTSVRVLAAPVENPRARIVVHDLETALANLAGEADSQAAVSQGRVTVTGLLPLADALDALLARVEAYLGPKARAAGVINSG